MATVALSTSSATLDPGTAYELTVLNSGTVSCHVQIGGGVGYDERLRPGQQTIIYPNGSAVTAFVRSGTGEVTTALSTNPETASSGGGAFITKTVGDGTYQLPFGPVLGVTGDSITARNAGAGSTSSPGDSWDTYACLAAGGRLQFGVNGAHGGYTSTQILALFPTEVLAVAALSAPSVIGLLVGTNDPLDGSNTAATTEANLTSFLTQSRTAGKPVFVGTIPPSGAPALTDPTAGPILTGTTGGTLASSTTYGYKYVALAGSGATLHTIASPETTVALSGSQTAVLAECPPIPGAIGYALYGRTAGSSWGLIATSIVQGQSPVGPRYFTDSGSVTPGAAAPGSNTTGVAVNSSFRQKENVVNSMIKKWGRKNKVPVVDFYTLLVDPATGKFKSGMTLDGTHPTPKASRMMGELVAAEVGSLLPAAAPYLVADNQDATNLFSNGCFITSSSGFPTSVNPGYGGTGQAASAVAARAGFAGNAWSLTRADASSSFNSVPNVTTGFAAGDVIEFGLMLETVGIEAAQGWLSVVLQANGASGTPKLFDLEIGGEVGPNPVGCRAVVPAGTTSLGLLINLANGAFTVYLGQITLRNLTTLGIAA